MSPGRLQCAQKETRLAKEYRDTREDYCYRGRRRRAATPTRPVPKSNSKSGSGTGTTWAWPMPNSPMANPSASTGAAWLPRRDPVTRFPPRGGQMRSSTAGLLVACMGVASMGSAQAQWTEAKIPGEQLRTAQGCAGETRNPGGWVPAPRSRSGSRGRTTTRDRMRCRAPTGSVPPGSSRGSEGRCDRARAAEARLCRQPVRDPL